jgi:hypothetical protein
MPLKPGKKIVINKPAGPGASKIPASPRKRPPVYRPPPEEKSDTRVIWVIVALVIAVFVIALLASYEKGQDQRQGQRQWAHSEYFSSPRPAAPKQEERLWMGDYMKRHGTAEELRARQERVREHESRRDIVQ